MKKLIAFVTAAVLLCSTSVFAAESPSAQAVLASAGFSSATDAQAAQSRGMSAGEYYNNAVTSAPGVSDAMPVGQGGKIMINGVATNLTATLSKVSSSVASSAKTQAGALGGTLLNVVKVEFPGANYNDATINFYVKGLAAETQVVAKQYVNGEWIDVEIVEIRADHVILNLKNAGAVAFVKVS